MLFLTLTLFKKGNKMTSKTYSQIYIINPNDFKDLVSSSGHPLRFDFAVFDDDGQIDFLI